jgi:hypothetical protein
MGAEGDHQAAVVTFPTVPRLNFEVGLNISLRQETERPDLS